MKASQFQPGILVGAKMKNKKKEQILSCHILCFLCFLTNIVIVTQLGANLMEGKKN